MKTATMAIGNPQTGPARPRRSLEELVDRLMATLTFRVEPEPAPVTASTGPGSWYPPSPATPAGGQPGRGTGDPGWRGPRRPLLRALRGGPSPSGSTW